jgi:hypothetical protein
MKGNSERIVLKTGEKLEIYLSKPGYKKRSSSLEQQADTSTRVSWRIIGPCKISVHLSKS